MVDEESGAVGTVGGCGGVGWSVGERERADDGWQREARAAGALPFETSRPTIPRQVAEPGPRHITSDTGLSGMDGMPWYMGGRI